MLPSEIGLSQLFNKCCVTWFKNSLVVKEENRTDMDDVGVVGILIFYIMAAFFLVLEMDVNILC